MLLRVVLFSCIGVAFEVVFTALLEYPDKKDVRLMGYSYIWMFPIYALIPFFMGFLYPRFGPWVLPARLGLYVAILLAVEYATGWLIRKATGKCPWEDNYYGRKWAIHGLIRLDFIPSWALACYLFERIYVALLPLP
jgi:hypothetical protein